MADRVRFTHIKMCDESQVQVTTLRKKSGKYVTNVFRGQGEEGNVYSKNKNNATTFHKSVVDGLLVNCGNVTYDN